MTAKGWVLRRKTDDGMVRRGNDILGFRDRLNFCIWGKETRNDKIDQRGSFPNPPD